MRTSRNTKLLCVALLTIFMVASCMAWRAIPANQAMYARRSDIAGLSEINEEEDVGLGIRDRLHSIYKFGFCEPHAMQKVFLHNAVNLTITTWQDAQCNYLYLLTDRHTQRFALQCVVMKIYVPVKFLFRRSRLPMYYCQGIMRLMVMNTAVRIEVHEFYFHRTLDLPATILFEFYHPPFI